MHVPGAVGRGRTASSTTSSTARRRHRGADQGPVDRRACSRCCAVVVGDRSCCATLPRRCGSGSPASSAQSRPEPGPAGVRRADRRRPGAARSASSPASACRASGSRSSTRSEFLSPYGLRALSSAYRDHPFWVDLAGCTSASVDYEPAESTHRHVRRQLQLARAGVDAGQLPRAAQPASATRDSLGDDAEVEYPTGRGRSATLADVRRRPARAAGLAVPAGRPTAADRATAGSTRSRTTRRGATTIAFNEYFHGDNGAGLGASPPDRLDRAGGRPDLPPDPFAGRRRGSCDARGRIAFGRGCAAPSTRPPPASGW